MSTFRFLHLTALVADAAALLSLLSRAVKVTNPMYRDVKDQVASCVSAIRALKDNKGCHLAGLGKVFPQGGVVPTEVVYQGHKIKDALKQRGVYGEATTEFTDALITSLETMLPDATTLQDFDSLWTKAEGDEGIQSLIDLYGRDVTGADGETLPAVIQPNAALQEWYLLQGMVDKLEGLQALYRFLNKNEVVYPNMAALVNLALTVPVTATDAGLGKYATVSAANHRTPLGVRAVEQCMTLSLEARTYTDFNYDQAFYEEWCRLPVWRPGAHRGDEPNTSGVFAGLNPLNNYDTSNSQ